MTERTVSFRQSRPGIRPASSGPKVGRSSVLPLASLYALAIGVGSVLIIDHLGLSGLRTWVLFWCVATLGLLLCERTRKTTRDPRLRSLSFFWLIKLIATFVLLFAGWIPELQPSGFGPWGYDPQRYYQYAAELRHSGWDLSWLSLNYTGIVYYYAALFYLFGHNPVAPAVFNSFVTLLGALFLVRFVYSRLPQPINLQKAWMLSFLILIPELLWHDVMTSRETLMAVALVITTLLIGERLVQVRQSSRTSSIFVLVLGLFVIMTIRTPLVLGPLLVALIFLAIVKGNPSRGLLTQMTVFSIVLGALVIGPQVQSILGGYDFDYGKVVSRVASVDEGRLLSRQWAEQSIGLLLVPDNFLESIIFLPPRMLLYLAAPLPNINVSIQGLIAGSWSDWQRLLVIPTSAIMLLGFPYVLAGTWRAWKKRSHFPALLIVPVAFWGIFVVVVGGNYVIHERYRIMVTPLLFATMWLGLVYCRRAEVTNWMFLWYLLLACAAVVYLVYKWLL